MTWIHCKAVPTSHGQTTLPDYLFFEDATGGKRSDLEVMNKMPRIKLIKSPKRHLPTYNTNQTIHKSQLACRVERCTNLIQFSIVLLQIMIRELEDSHPTPNFADLR